MFTLKKIALGDEEVTHSICIYKWQGFGIFTVSVTYLWEEKTICHATYLQSSPFVSLILDRGVGPRGNTVQNQGLPGGGDLNNEKRMRGGGRDPKESHFLFSISSRSQYNEKRKTNFNHSTKGK